MNTAKIGIFIVVSLCVIGCSRKNLSDFDAQTALIELAEGQGDPLALTVPGLKSGNIRYVTGEEEGISPGIWEVNLSEKTFYFLAASLEDNFFHSYKGEFRLIEDEWKAEITDETWSD